MYVYLLHASSFLHPFSTPRLSSSRDAYLPAEAGISISSLAATAIPLSRAGTRCRREKESARRGERERERDVIPANNR